MRLIDAGALIEVLQNREIHAESFDKRIAIKGDRQVVINAPTIDAVPKHQFSEETSTLDTCPYYHHEPTGEPFCEMEDRRHGKWIAEEEYGDLWVCDQCGFASEYNDNFCPNCGAKMDGERNE